MQLPVNQAGGCDISPPFFIAYANTLITTARGQENVLFLGPSGKICT